mgnify:CR=1 FL=1
MRNDSLKVILSTVTALTGIGGSWYSMEDRVSRLELQLEQQEKIKVVQLELAQMMRDEELAELKHKIKLDSLRREHDIR